MPMPLSLTSTRRKPLCCASATVTFPGARSENLAALDNRLSITCIRRSRSATMPGTFCGNSTVRSIFRSLNS